MPNHHSLVPKKKKVIVSRNGISMRTCLEISLITMHSTLTEGVFHKITWKMQNHHSLVPKRTAARQMTIIVDRIRSFCPKSAICASSNPLIHPIIHAWNIFQCPKVWYRVKLLSRQGCWDRYPLVYTLSRSGVLVYLHSAHPHLWRMRKG